MSIPYTIIVTDRDETTSNHSESEIIEIRLDNTKPISHHLAIDRRRKVTSISHIDRISLSRLDESGIEQGFDKQDTMESYETIRKASDVSNTSKLSCGNLFVYYYEFTQDWYSGLECSYNYRIIINDFQLVASLLEEVRVPQLTTEVKCMEL